MTCSRGTAGTRAGIAVVAGLTTVALSAVAAPAAALAGPAGTPRSPVPMAAPPAAAMSPAMPGPAAAAAADPGPPGPAEGLRRTGGCSPPGLDGPGAAASAVLPRSDLATGGGQLVAVVDTGVAPVPRLADRLRGGGDYLTGGDGLDDCDGHGSAVALLLAGAADPATGTGAGVAPDAEVVALRQSSARFAVRGPDGAERPAGEIRTLAAAISRAVTLGAGVINVSEVVCVPADRVEELGRPVADAVAAAEAAGVLVVAAAGNVDPAGTCTGEPELRPLPASYDGVVAVGATDAAGRPAPFSVPGPWVDLAAPGVDLPAPAGPEGAVVSGTSYAAPLVAGTAALLRERFPMLTPGQVADRLRATARHPASGRDDRVGAGVLDPVAALTAEPLLLTPVPDARPAAGIAAGPRTGSGDAAPARHPLPAPGTEPRDLPVVAGAGAVAAVSGATAALLAGLRRRPAR
ncbi:type VII secretion-associated serine protease mycosin [Pseudonocardia nematodicida]|uniref:type VII secretion-associated serine protease mycosin n=1 Tax=Pseudonocardia nematodicida TaxID=1206997 RepID=UPI0036133439